MALSDYSAVDQQIIRTVIGAEGLAPSNADLVLYQAYVAENGINALSNLLIAEDAALLTNEALADQIVANFGIIEATGVVDQATAYVLGRLNKEGADVGAIIAQIATVLGTPELSGNLNPIYLDVASTFQATTVAGLESSASPAAFGLTASLDAIAAAEAAEVAYLQANSIDTDDDGLGDATDDTDFTAAITAAQTVVTTNEGLTGDEINGVAGYVKADYVGASAGLKAAIVADVQAAHATTLEALEVTETDAQADVTAIVGLQGAVNTQNAAIAAKVVTAEAVTAADTAEATASAEWLAIAAIQTDVDTVADSGAGVLSVAYDNAGGIMADDYAIVLTKIVAGVAVLTAAADVAEDATDSDEIDFIEALQAHASVATFLAAFNASEVADAADAVAGTAVTDAATALDLVDGDATDDTDVDAAAALATAAAAVDAQEVIDADLAAAVAAEAAAEAAEVAAQAIDDAFTDLETATAAAITAAEEGETDAAGDDYVIDSAAGGLASTANNDVHMANELGDGEAETLATFGAQATDVIYFGDAVLNTGAIATDGDNAVLEFFMTDDGTDTTIVLETSVVGSNTTGLVDTASITLTGVTVDELSVDGGLVTLA